MNIDKIFNDTLSIVIYGAIIIAVIIFVIKWLKDLYKSED